MTANKAHKKAAREQAATAGGQLHHGAARHLGDQQHPIGMPAPGARTISTPGPTMNPTTDRSTRA